MTTKTTAHTPGPWTATRLSSNGLDKGIRIWHGRQQGYETDMNIASITWNQVEARPEEAAANARLIAAAPDMLVALTKIEKLSANVLVQRLAQVAIAKAEGGAA